MSKTAKIKKFKYAFLKPKQTRKDLVKTKTDIEKAIKSLKKGSDDDVEKKLKQAVDDLTYIDEDYMKELIQYKLVKHWDEPEELKFWMTKCSKPETNVEVVKKILSDKPNKDMVVDCWKKMRGQHEIADLCYDLFPDEVEEEIVKVMLEGKNAHMPKDRESKLARRIFEEGNGDKLNSYYKSGLAPEDLQAMAKKKPSEFIKTFVQGQSVDAKTKILSDPKLRESLKAGGPEWTELAKTTPLLPFLEKAKLRERPAPNKEASVIDSLFAEVLAPDGTLGLTYYTNSLTPVPNMLASTKDDQVKAVKERKEGIAKAIESEKELKKKKGDTTPVDTDQLDRHPDGPGTQCDVLVSLMTTLIGSTLGPDVKCKHKVFKGMVLTDKMSKFPGGLLSSSFGGNVFDDSDTLTGQVLFTGGADDGVSNAHTILEVNGMQYDAVLGTSGKDLSHTVVDEYPAWDKTNYLSLDGKPIRVSKSTKTAYWIINEPGLKAAPNKHGFGTAYRMTDKPEKYIKAKDSIPTGEATDSGAEPETKPKKKEVGSEEGHSTSK
ncbi:MAG: hypothetical protein JNK76_15625 [Planctomycetales bacterium]|nr:hypothetical protein [Planctomycetales bacterium]MBN8624164.1 hypothetical protein [Planctomycetota bacterium]